MRMASRKSLMLRLARLRKKNQYRGAAPATASRVAQPALVEKVRPERRIRATSRQKPSVGQDRPSVKETSRNVPAMRR
jgi:hypothetical protein